jgi:hypothetical protein
MDNLPPLQRRECATDRRKISVFQRPPRREARIVSVDLDRERAPAQVFGDAAGGVGAGEKIDNQVAGSGEEFDKEFWQVGREARRV